MLPMPSDTDFMSVQRPAREFAQVELGDRGYVIAVHDHHGALTLKRRAAKSRCLELSIAFCRFAMHSRRKRAEPL